MLTHKRLITIFLLTSTVGCSNAEEVFQNCPSSYHPIKSLAPKIPPVADSQFKGSIKSILLVNERGDVFDATIALIDLHQIDRGRKNPVGYDKAVLDAVKNWKFPRSNMKCKKMVTINFSLRDD